MGWAVLSDALDWIEDRAEDVTSLADDTLAILADAYEESGDLLGEAGAVLAPLLAEAGEGLVDIGDALGGEIRYISGAVVAAGRIVHAELLDSLGDLVGWIIDGVIWLAEVVEDVGDLAASALALVGEFAFDAVTLNSNILDHLVENFEDFAGDFLRLYETTLKGAFALTENLYEILVAQPLGILAQALDGIPYIGDALSKTIRVVNDLIGFGLQLAEALCALPNMIACQYTDWLEADPDLEDLIVQIVDAGHSGSKESRVRILPAVDHTTKYVIFSDLHRFVSGDTDFFTQNRAADLLKSLLRHYALQSYTLIENGDVEDLWRRDSGNPHIDNALGAGTRSSNKSLLRAIAESHTALYHQINSDFVATDRYFRTAGNHDIALLESYMKRLISNEILHGVEVHEFLLIKDSTPHRFSHLITHGHQSDNFNRAGCEWFGESVTRLVTRFFEVPILGEFMKGISSAEPDVTEQFTKGRRNVLDSHEYLGMYATLDEPGLYNTYQDHAGRVDLPWLIAGHSHDPKYVPGVESLDDGCDGAASTIPPAWGPQVKPPVGGYLNTGTTGMMKDIVWFAVIEPAIDGSVATLLKAAVIDDVTSTVRVRTYRSVAACTPLIDGNREPAQWLEPIAGSEFVMPLVD